jgi:hypothetical protein
MRRSRSGKPDPVLEGVELLFQQKGGLASFGAKVALSLNGVDLSCMNSITGSTCRAKCSNILHDKRKLFSDKHSSLFMSSINDKISI